MKQFLKVMGFGAPGMGILDGDKISLDCLLLGFGIFKKIRLSIFELFLFSPGDFWREKVFSFQKFRNRGGGDRDVFMFIKQLCEESKVGIIIFLAKCFVTCKHVIDVPYCEAKYESSSLFAGA